MSRYIDAAALGIGKANRDVFENKSYADGWNAAIDIIESAPTVDVKEVRRGVWLPILESEITGWNPEFAGRDPVGGYICSICKNEAIYSCNNEWVLSAFCPNCGKKMDGGDKS